MVPPNVNHYLESVDVSLWRYYSVGKQLSFLTLKEQFTNHETCFHISGQQIVRDAHCLQTSQSGWRRKCFSYLLQCKTRTFLIWSISPHIRLLQLLPHGLDALWHARRNHHFWNVHEIYYITQNSCHRNILLLPYLPYICMQYLYVFKNIIFKKNIHAYRYPISKILYVFNFMHIIIITCKIKN